MVLKNFACWVILHGLLLSVDFFKINLFRKILSGTPSETLMVFLKEFSEKPDFRVSNRLELNQIRHFVRCDLGSNCLQRLSAENTSRLTLCILCNFACFMSADSFLKQLTISTMNKTWL